MGYKFHIVDFVLNRRQGHKLLGHLFDTVVGYDILFVLFVQKPSRLHIHAPRCQRRRIYGAFGHLKRLCVHLFENDVFRQLVFGI